VNRADQAIPCANAAIGTARISAADQLIPQFVTSMVAMSAAKSTPANQSTAHADLPMFDLSMDRFSSLP
jgi:hypothetical protein